MQARLYLPHINWELDHIELRCSQLQLRLPISKSTHFVMQANTHDPWPLAFHLHSEVYVPVYSSCRCIRPLLPTNGSRPWATARPETLVCSDECSAWWQRGILLMKERAGVERGGKWCGGVEKKWGSMERDYETKKNLNNTFAIGRGALHRVSSTDRRRGTPSRSDCVTFGPHGYRQWQAVADRPHPCRGSGHRALRFVCSHGHCHFRS